MARRPLSDAELARVSERCALLLAREGTDVSAADLAATAGMSERTFFRYFPTKADCMRPFLAQGHQRFTEEIEALAADGGGTPVGELVRNAFINVFDRHPFPDTGGFLTALLENVHYRRVWLEINYDLQVGLEPVMARVLGETNDSLRARAAAAGVTAFAATTIMEMVRTGGSVHDLAHAVQRKFSEDPLAVEH